MEWKLYKQWVLWHVKQANRFLAPYTPTKRQTHGRSTTQLLCSFPILFKLQNIVFEAMSEPKNSRRLCESLCMLKHYFRITSSTARNCILRSLATTTTLATAKWLFKNIHSWIRSYIVLGKRCVWEASGRWRGGRVAKRVRGGVENNWYNCSSVTQNNLIRRSLIRDPWILNFSNTSTVRSFQF